MTRISDKTIGVLAFRRVYYHSKRNNCNNLNYPDVATYEEIIKTCIDSGFRCFYCNKKLKVRDKYPFKDVLSIDHKIPISRGGNSKINNLVVCCYGCNMKKGNLTAEEFIKECAENDGKDNKN